MVALFSTLPDSWTLLRGRRIGDGAAPTEIVLIHPGIGIAVVDNAGDPGAAAARLRDYLARQGFGAFFPGDLPVVALALAAADVPVAGERLAAAFEASPPLTIADPDWADGVVELLLAADDRRSILPAEPPAAAATAASLPERVPLPPPRPAAKPAPDWVTSRAWGRSAWMAAAAILAAAVTLMASPLAGPSDDAPPTPVVLLAALPLLPPPLSPPPTLSPPPIPERIAVLPAAIPDPVPPAAPTKTEPAPAPAPRRPPAHHALPAVWSEAAGAPALTPRPHARPRATAASCRRSGDAPPDHPRCRTVRHPPPPGLFVVITRAVDGIFDRDDGRHRHRHDLARHHHRKASRRVATARPHIDRGKVAWYRPISPITVAQSR